MSKLVLFVIIFLIIGGFIITKTYNTDFKEKEDVKDFTIEFGKWVFHLGRNVKDTTAFVVKQEWLPSNNTNETK